jgi:ElaB/YqjD/DUF883 family membrane-anchored ribosome-binding protein
MATPARDMSGDTMTELSNLTEQAERLLKSLGDETSQAAEALRHRVNRTLHQARIKMANSNEYLKGTANNAAHQADDYVHANPWKAVSIGVAAGALTALLLTHSMRRGRE